MNKKTIDKTLIFVLFSMVLLLAMPLATAYRTDITVKTKPNMLVSINIDDPVSDDKLLYKFERADNISGIYSINYSTALEKINIKVKSIDNQNVIIGTKEIKNYITGEALFIDFVEEEKPEVNETETQENETIEEIVNESEPEERVEEIEENKTGITGLVFSTFKENFSKTIYYIIGIVFLIGVIMFFIISRKKLTMRGEKAIKIKKLSELQKEKEEAERNPEEYETDELREVEKKIKEAQEEIEKIKNREGKIRQAEKRFEEAKGELERLRG